MQVVEQIATPWTPWSVMFSRDGTRLAVGGGTWYGDGGIFLQRLEDCARASLDWFGLASDADIFTSNFHSERERLQAMSEIERAGQSLTGIPGVVSVYFSDDDRTLAAAFRHQAYGYAPRAIFEVRSLELVLRSTLHDPLARDARAGANGIVLRGNQLIARNFDLRRGTQPITAVTIPAELALPPNGGQTDHLTHSRVAVARDMAMTSNDSFLTPRNGHGLASLRADGTEEGPHYVPHGSAVTAIASLPGGESFLTGGWYGEMDRWTWNDSWIPQRIRAFQETTEHCVSNIVSMADGRVITVSGNDLLVDAGGREERRWPIPVRGSPRTLAAHPGLPLVAVGLKQGHFDNPAASVALIDVD